MNFIHKSKQSKLWQVGVVGPLTGKRSAYGEILQQAVASKQKNSEIKWILADDQANPICAKKIAIELVDLGVNAVIGHFNSACAEVVSKIYSINDIPLLLPASTHPKLTMVDGVFRLCPHDKTQIDLIHNLLNQIDNKRIEIVIDDSSYSQRLLSLLFEVQPLLKAQIVSCLLSPNYKIKNQLILATHNNAALHINHLIKSKWRGTVICTDDAYIEDFANLVKSNTNVNILVVAPHATYQCLTDKALSLIHKAYINVSKTNLKSWLYFNPEFTNTGESSNAYWKVYQVKEGDFIPFPNPK
jgi:branched-chain amino acid transport system substrate-binding protein